MELAVAGLVTSAADVMEALEEGQYSVEVLEPLEFMSSERAVVGRIRHGMSPPGWQSLCLAEPIAQNLCRTDVTMSRFSLTITLAMKIRTNSIQARRASE